MSFFSSLVLTFIFLGGVTAVLFSARRLAEFCTKGYGLDIVVTLYTAAAPIYFAIRDGIPGLLGSIVGSMSFLYAFCAWHANRSGYRGPTINGLLGSRVGFLRNQLALLATVPAVPVFLQIRLAEIFLYPFFIRLVRFPKYDQNEWVNVSRQKHKGLVGSDLIWCLYCDWMTGVYSLGAEMLRNVESFWCPLRFLSPGKCANCRVDFPDIDVWANPKDGSVKPVVDLLREKYFTGRRKSLSWFGHPDRKGDAKSRAKR